MACFPTPANPTAQAQPPPPPPPTPVVVVPLPPGFKFVVWLKEGRVAVAEAPRTGAKVAVKHCPVKSDFERERAVLYALRRSAAAPFVVAIDSDFEAESSNPGFLVLEQLYKSLPDFLGAPKDQAVLQGLAKNICLALAALHAAGYAHLDFKPHQVCIAVADDTKVKLVDFDAARRPGEPCAATFTYMYAPPERFLDPAGRASFKMDVFPLAS